jgi:hypothetical protein
MPEPCDTDAVADGEFITERGADTNYLRDHLVSGHDVWPMLGEVALCDVQIGSTYAAGQYAHEQVAGRWLRNRGTYLS